MNSRPYLVGIAGGSCSGKTTFADRLKDELPDDDCLIIRQDDYYHDQSKKFDHDGGSVNFDHPDALDFKLLATQLCELKQNTSVLAPRYDFLTHARKKETVLIKPCSIVLVEGTLIFHDLNVRNHFDLRVFIDASSQERFERRLKRDTQERGRSESGVIQQFQKQVDPMHNLFVDPSSQFAHHQANQDTFDHVFFHVLSLLRQELKKP